jgi:hypothetical protein
MLKDLRCQRRDKAQAKPDGHELEEPGQDSFQQGLEFPV